MPVSRTVFFVSESTGITAESLGESLLSQFPDVGFQKKRKPFVNTQEAAAALAEECVRIYHEDGLKPLIFATMPDESINSILKETDCFYFELFNHFVDDIGEAIGVSPTRQSGIIHGLSNSQSYDDRMDIVNYTLLHDDAMTIKNIQQADVILIGVSRSGKTPTCLYLALHFGIRAANYPLTEDDFRKNDIPEILKENKDKLVGLTIQPKRLSEIREKRRPASDYATLATCRSEVNHALDMFRRYQLPVFDTTSSSIEELSARIMQNLRVKEPVTRK